MQVELAFTSGDDTPDFSHSVLHDITTENQPLNLGVTVGEPGSCIRLR